MFPPALASTRPAEVPQTMPDPDQSSYRHVRVRFLSAEIEVTPASRCEVEVRVDWVGGTVFSGTSTGNDTTEGRVRAGARATVAAVQRVTDDQFELELRGTKVIRAFDAYVVIASVRGRSPEARYDLLGSAVAPDGDLVRGGILAILDGTNRILEKYAPPRPVAESSTTPREE